MKVFGLPVWLVAAGAVVGAVVLALTQPWLLFVDAEVDEEINFPIGDGVESPDPNTGDELVDPSPGSDSSSESEAQASEPVEPTAAATPTIETLASGSWISRDHPTSGDVRILAQGDQRIVRFDDLATDNGPDLFVYLSTAPADAPATDFDAEGEFVNLGRLKGNIGNQNYELSSDINLSRFQSVVIWCDRFNVVFGAANLA